MVLLKLVLAAGLVVASIAQAQAQSPEVRSTSSGSGEILIGRGRTGPSSFHAEVRGDVTTTASGEAEFGAVHTVDQSSAAFVVSLGICGVQSAIMFTRGSEAPLAVGRYRISGRASGRDEVHALVLTGSPTHPTGVFPGQSGWLVVTESSDRLITGRFQIVAIGFLAGEPQKEGRRINVTGSFSATPASSSFRVCQDSE